MLCRKVRVDLRKDQASRFFSKKDNGNIIRRYSLRLVFLLFIGCAVQVTASPALPFTPTPGLADAFGVGIKARTTVLGAGSGPDGVGFRLDFEETFETPREFTGLFRTTKKRIERFNVSTQDIKVDFNASQQTGKFSVFVDALQMSTPPVRQISSVFTQYEIWLHDVIYVFREDLLPPTDPVTIKYSVNVDAVINDNAPSGDHRGGVRTTAFIVGHSTTTKRPAQSGITILKIDNGPNRGEGIVSFEDALIQFGIDIRLSGRGGTEEDGRIEVTLDSAVRIDEIPPGYVCRSESGTFPGCDDGAGPEPELPDIAISNVRVTQAVFGSNKLAKGRKTVVFADVELLEGEVSEPVLIGAHFQDELAVTKMVSFGPNETIKPDEELELVPEREGIGRKLTVKANFFDEIKESNEKNNTEIKTVDVLTTKLEFPYVLTLHPECDENPVPQPCVEVKNSLTNLINQSNQFLWDVFPLPNNQLPGVGIDPIGVGLNFSTLGQNNIQSGRVGNEQCGIITASIGWIDDLRAVDEIREKGGWKRAVGIVPDNYFEYHSLPFAIGIHQPDGFSVLAEFGTTQTFIATSAHELAHTFGVVDGYLKCGEPSGNFITEAYNVRLDTLISRAVDLMDKPTKDMSNAPLWINVENWDKMVQGLNNIAKDPEIISIGVLFEKDNGISKIYPWSIFNGFPDQVEPGPYSIDFININGQIIKGVPFQVNFKVNIDPLGEMDSQFSLISFASPFPEEAVLVNIVGPNREILASIDPDSKILNDAIIRVAGQCFTDNQERFLLDNNIAIFQQQLENNNISVSIEILNDIHNIATQIMVDNCEVNNPLKTTKEDLLSLIDNTTKRLETRIVEEQPIPGDIDNDGDVDRDDLNIILAARNTAASGPDDPRDLDGDGMITALDARKLTLLCTRTRCASE